jgi:hypothetical protein
MGVSCIVLRPPRDSESLLSQLYADYNSARPESVMDGGQVGNTGPQTSLFPIPPNICGQ